MSEVEELRAEVERLTEELDRERLSQDYKPDGVDIVMGKLQDARRRAEAAAAKLRDVEALRDKWLAVDVPSAEVTSWSHYAGAALRVVLARSQADA